MPKSTKKTAPEAEAPEAEARLKVETMGEFLDRNGGKRPQSSPDHGFAVSTMGEYVETRKAKGG